MPTRDELLQQLYKLDYQEFYESKMRHRIASRLRACGVETRVWCAPASAQDTLDDIVCATDFESSEAKTIQEHLADLIEPEYTYRMDTVRSNAVHLLRFYEKEELLQLEASPGKEDLFAERMEQVASLTESEAKTIYGKLADLIELEPERTCRDFGGEEGTNGEQYEFACSACGFIGDILQPNYCPSCGAKVVEDGD